MEMKRMRDEGDGDGTQRAQASSSQYERKDGCSTTSGLQMPSTHPLAISKRSSPSPSPHPSLQSTAYASSSTLLPSTPSTSSDYALTKSASSSRGFRLTPTHQPIPAKTVFARGAAPLYLPSLDTYLNAFVPPTFNFPVPSSNVGQSSGTAVKKNAKKKDEPKYTKMFPPMDRLAATKRSLQDLETNSIIPSALKNRNSVFNSLVGATLGIAGSSAVAMFYSLQGILDTMQIFALLLATIIPNGGTNLDSKWKQLLLGTIPNILALNPTSSLLQSIIFLLLFMTIAALLLYYFYISTNALRPKDLIEGFQSSQSTQSTSSRPTSVFSRITSLFCPKPTSTSPLKPSSGWDILLVTFVLTFLYLPLSTIAVHALVWSSDFWVVPNPYINATSYPPILPPLGPADEFRDPLDFCWTTTMKRNEVNWAPVVVIVSGVCFVFMTLWFPYRLHKVVKDAVPVVDRYTELGNARSSSEMNREYQRLLARDRNPLAFLYTDFRRGWGTYKALYLLFKFSALLIVAVINPDTCLFRSIFPASKVLVVRSSILVVTMLSFLGVQSYFAPFVDPVNNASEWTSRLNYVLTSAIGLCVALDVPGEAFLDGAGLYIVYVVTYGLSFYFTIIHASWARRLVKRLTHRIDFSIDIFSPRLDISSSSVHAKRRIWQESISTLFLTSQECKIPDSQPMHYAQARDAEYPPYLLDFKGSPAERHVENLKVLREVGSVAYAKGLATISAGKVDGFHRLEAQIQRHYVGPDCYWRSTKDSDVRSTKGFGNAWWLPFPPTLVFRYDDGPLVVLKDFVDFGEYVTQNQSGIVRKSRAIRMALRALDGKSVTWPYEHVQPVGARMNVFYCCRRQYDVHKLVRYDSCMLTIKHTGNLPWKGLDLGSGFETELKYAKDVIVDGSVIGLNDDFDLTPALARFLSMNHVLISENLSDVQTTLQDYRDTLRRECVTKADVLSYRFLMNVYDQPQDWRTLAGDEGSVKLEKDLRVRELIVGNQIAVEMAYRRYAAVTSSEVTTWWYVFWDDLWRRNFDVISAMRTYEEDFSPHYPTSITYMPLSRPLLERFLVQRGVMSRPPKSSDFIHSGFLNKLYLRLNEIVFQGSSKGIMFHLGDDATEVDLDEIDFDIDLATQARPSTLGTGGGTDHDDVSIRARPTYRWEGLLQDSLILDHGDGTIKRLKRNYNRDSKPRKRRWKPKWGVWFGITPLWRMGKPSKGLALDVKLENGRYVLLELDKNLNSDKDTGCGGESESKDEAFSRLQALTKDSRL